MKNPKIMTNSPALDHRDRLSAFFLAFDLTVTLVHPEQNDAKVNLLVVGDAQGKPMSIHFFARGMGERKADEAVLVAANVHFGGSQNPLLNSLPQQLTLDIDEGSSLHAIAFAFVIEAGGCRCGRDVALERLCEVLVLMVLRAAIDQGASKAGVLAGLSHPALYKAIVAIHNQPARPWRVENLAELCGLSRSRFMTLFPKVVGITPSAYLTNWRLTLARRELAKGERVKVVANRVGFSSAEVFTRAYKRVYGQAPTEAPRAPPRSTA